MHIHPHIAAEIHRQRHAELMAAAAASHAVAAVRSREHTGPRRLPRFPMLRIRPLRAIRAR